MAKKEGARRRGLFEFPVRFVPRDGGAPVESMLTPSMWAVADEFADELRATGKHTEAWVAAKMTGAARLQAAQAEGLVRGGAVTLAKIVEMDSIFEVEDVAEADDAAEAGENPTEGGAGA